MKDFSIEYSHIYKDEIFSFNHLQSIKIAKSIFTQLKKENRTFTTCVMIDDYNPTEHILDYKKFQQSLIKHNALPDLIIFESELLPYVQTTLDLIPSQRIKKGYIRYIDNKSSVPCSLFIITWYLIRLGIIKFSNKKIITAKKIITILHKDFSPVELIAQKGLNSILGNKRYDELIKLIFFDGVHKFKHRILE